LKPILEIENLSKRYSLDTGAPEKFVWALKGVNLSVQKGEVVGIIGENGSGKTTLLKLLARITKPTTGKITLRAKVGALLQVGTGFHSDLTGKENIYLNGAILGLKRDEIDRKYREIVAFSEIESFMATPIKFYSKGMAVRLAFSVAAHLDPEILLIDEALGVGDASFYRKSIEKIEEIMSRGATVFLVSHRLGIIERLCSRVLWLNQGALELDGEPREVIDKYLERAAVHSEFKSGIRNPQPPEKSAYFEQLKMLDEAGRESRVFKSGGKAVIEARIKAAENIQAFFILEIVTMTGTIVTRVDTDSLGFKQIQVKDGLSIRWDIGELRLTCGVYALNLAMRGGPRVEAVDILTMARVFEVISDADRGDGLAKPLGVTYMPIAFSLNS
jgi:lipopolysaccharide transport system ATP-binding protein